VPWRSPLGRSRANAAAPRRAARHRRARSAELDVAPDGRTETSRR